ncbi:MAG: hypothetical protein GC181_04605 [Bacteroidetes bacterium]|nr:hypothetical protein [Bacteroidota bacterium]
MNSFFFWIVLLGFQLKLSAQNFGGNPGLKYGLTSFEMSNNIRSGQTPLISNFPAKLLVLQSEINQGITQGMSVQRGGIPYLNIESGLQTITTNSYQPGYGDMNTSLTSNCKDWLNFEIKYYQNKSFKNHHLNLSAFAAGEIWNLKSNRSNYSSENAWKNGNAYITVGDYWIKNNREAGRIDLRAGWLGNHRNEKYVSSGGTPLYNSTGNQNLFNSSLTFTKNVSANIKWISEANILILNGDQNAVFNDKLNDRQLNLNSNLTFTRQYFSIQNKVFAQFNQFKDLYQSAELFQLYQNFGFVQEYSFFGKNRRLNLIYQHTFRIRNGDQSGFDYLPFIKTYFHTKNSKLKCSAGAGITSQTAFISQVIPQYLRSGLRNLNYQFNQPELYRNFWFHGQWTFYREKTISVVAGNQTSFNKLLLTSKGGEGGALIRSFNSLTQATVSIDNFFRTNKFHTSVHYTFSKTDNRNVGMFVPQHNVMLNFSSANPNAWYNYSRYIVRFHSYIKIQPNISLGYISGYDLPIVAGSELQKQKAGITSDMYLTVNYSKSYYGSPLLYFTLGVTNLMNYGNQPASALVQFQQAAFRQVMPARFYTRISWYFKRSDY